MKIVVPQKTLPEMIVYHPYTRFSFGGIVVFHCRLSGHTDSILVMFTIGPCDKIIYLPWRDEGHIARDKQRGRITMFRPA